MYEIAGVKMKFFADFDVSMRLKPYQSNFSDNPDVIITITKCKSIPKNRTKLLLDDVIKWHIDTENNVIQIDFPDDYYKEGTTCRLCVNKQWTNATIYYIKKETNCENAILNIFGNIIMRNRILFQQGILLHASSIQFNNEGIIFSAPSGTGKSTHSALWEQYYNACVINDDTPALKLFDNHIMVCGTPWSGSLGKHSNISATLKAIVILEQYPENCIRKLTEKESITSLIPRFMLPYHNKKLMETAMEYINHIVKSTPVYLLKCRPDREAAELVHRTLF